MKKLYRFDNSSRVFSAYAENEANIRQGLTDSYGDLAVKHVQVFNTCNCRSDFKMHCMQRDVVCSCDCHDMGQWRA